MIDLAPRIRPKKALVEVAIATTILLLLSGCSSPATRSSSNSGCEEQVFSDVRHIEESDDYVGTEILLKLCKGRADVAGEWREYEGYHPVTTTLKGQKNGEIRLQGNSTAGAVSLTGSVSGGRLRGTLLWHIGTNPQTKTLDLAATKFSIRPPQ
ncbi:MAG: hypothetical protein AB7V46_21980 [Thermomicrobiales bacterium]